MIESITIENFLSFKDKTTFDFKASSERNAKGFENIHWFAEIDRKKILKTVFFFGNNGTGKTNFLNVFSVLNDLATKYRTSKSSEEDRLPNVSFRLSDSTKDAPSSIDVIFHINGTIYEYYIRWDEDIIYEENLFKSIGRKKEKEIFSRTYNADNDIVRIEFPPKSSEIPEETQKVIRQNTIKNTSVISVYDGKNMVSEDLRLVHSYFDSCRLWNVKSYDLASMITRRSDEETLKKVLLAILKDIGSTICDYKVDEISIKLSDSEKRALLSRMPEEQFYSIFPNGERKFQRLSFAYRTAEREEKFWLPENLESEGTQEAIRLVIVLFDCIMHNTPLAIDECAQSVNPEVLKYIIQFFLKASKESQVFFASQAITILNMEGYRRDTARFIDKDPSTGSSSFQLVDKKKYHKKMSIYNAYINNSFGGKSGLIPDKEWNEHLNKIAKMMDD